MIMVMRGCRYAAASLIGSIASLGLAEINAINGARLVKPLMWLLRSGDAAGKCAAMRGLMFLSDDAQCRTVLGRVCAPSPLSLSLSLSAPFLRAV